MKGGKVKDIWSYIKNAPFESHQASGKAKKEAAKKGITKKYRSTSSAEDYAQNAPQKSYNTTQKAFQKGIEKVIYGVGNKIPEKTNRTNLKDNPNQISSIRKTERVSQKSGIKPDKWQNVGWIHKHISPEQRRLIEKTKQALNNHTKENDESD